MFGISLYFIIAFKGLIAIPEEVELQASFKTFFQDNFRYLWGALCSENGDWEGVTVVLGRMKIWNSSFAAWHS